jgi:hypothetical protein
LYVSESVTFSPSSPQAVLVVWVSTPGSLTLKL